MLCCPSMKYLELFFLSTLLFFKTAYAADQYTIVSDIDDTIKITNVGNAADAIENALFSRKAFTGMPTLYRQFKKEISENGIRYLSATGSYLQWAVNAFLSKNDFPIQAVYLKKNLLQKSIEFKVETLTKINSELAPQVKLILIGDNTEHDHEIYDAFQKAHPEKVLHIYIHQITGRKIPDHQTRFVTAFDIAKYEFIEKRMSLESALIVGTSVAIAMGTEKKAQKLIPKYMLCDSELKTPVSQEPTLEQMTGLIQKKLYTICQNR